MRRLKKSTRILASRRRNQHTPEQIVNDIRCYCKLCVENGRLENALLELDAAFRSLTSIENVEAFLSRLCTDQLHSNEIYAFLGFCHERMKDLQEKETKAIEHLFSRLLEQGQPGCLKKLFEWMALEPPLSNNAPSRDLGYMHGCRAMHLLVRYVQKCLQEKSQFHCDLMLAFIRTDLKVLLILVSSEMRLSIAGVLAPLSILESKIGFALMNTFKPWIHNDDVGHSICCMLLDKSLDHWEIIEQDFSFRTAVSRNVLSCILKRNVNLAQTCALLRKIGDRLMANKEVYRILCMDQELLSVFREAFLNGLNRLNDPHSNEEISSTWMAAVFRCLFALEEETEPWFATHLLWCCFGALSPQQTIVKTAFWEVYLEQCVHNHKIVSLVGNLLKTKMSPFKALSNMESSVESHPIRTLILFRRRQRLEFSGHPFGKRELAMTSNAFVELLRYLVENPSLLKKDLENEVVFEVNEMIECVSLTAADQVKILPLLIQLDRKWMESTTSRKGKAFIRQTWLKTLMFILERWPTSQMRYFFETACLAFDPAELDGLFIVSLTKMEKCRKKYRGTSVLHFPMTTFLTWVLMHSKLNKTIAEIRRTRQPSIDTTFFDCVKMAIRCATDIIQKEAETDKNAYFPHLQKMFENHLVDNLIETSSDDSDEEHLCLWLCLGSKEDLMRKCSWLLNENIAQYAPNFWFNWIHMESTDSFASALDQIPKEIRYRAIAEQFSTLAQWILPMIEEQLLESAFKEQVMVLSTLFICMMHHEGNLIQLQGSADALTEKWATCIVNNCVFVSQILQAGRKRGWFDCEASLDILEYFQLAAVKVEAFLDALEPMTDDDFYQIRAPFESVLKTNAQIFTPHWLRLLLGEETEESTQFQSPPRMQPRLSSPGLIETHSKSFIYKLDIPSQSHCDVDLREWFDEDDTNRRPRRQSHPFLEACLQEEGGKEGIDEDDLAILENFIVPSEGRDYVETFRRKYGFFYQDAETRPIEFPNTPLCCDTSTNEALFGCEGGEVLMVDAQLTTKFAFVAHGHSVLQLKVLKAQNWILTVGTEEPGVSSATLKLWNIEQLLAQGDQRPNPLRCQKLFSARFPESEITVLEAKQKGEEPAVVAIGLASGNVYWMQLDLLKDRWTFQKLATQPLGSTDRFAVRGLGLHEVNEEDNKLFLYVVTESQTLVFNLQTLNRVVLDESGAEDHCVMMKEDGQLIVSRPQALYFYNIEGRGACFAFNEDHHHLASTGQNLVVVHNTKLENGVVLDGVKVFDLGNKLVVGERSVSNARYILTAWGMILIVQGDGTVVCLREIPLASKLEALFRRNCHGIALRLAEAEKADAATLAYIHHQYADHLYNDKRDYEAAMQQYIYTIRHLEPSYVIRRYLDTQRIQQLTLYLEELHEQGIAIADHTTLLLNCYTKMKDVEKLNSFIGVGDSNQLSPSRKKINFDVETAVKVLRTAGYWSHALEVARFANEPHWYVDILLENLGDYEECIKYVFGLPRQQAAEVFKKYGKALVGNKPRDSTGCLMKLCVPEKTETSSSSKTEFVASVADFTHLYDGRPQALIELCEFVFHVYTHLTISPPSEDQLYHTLFELFLSETARFLETEEEPSTERGGPYSSMDFGTQPSEEDKRDKALNLLKQGWTPGDNPKYDPEHMLVLCRTYHFKEGLVFLYERKSLLREVLQVYIDAKDYNGIISACRTYGDSTTGGDPLLWSEALHYFSSNQEDCTPQIKEVLEHIEREDVLPPLVVLNTLSRNPRLKLKIVKEYIAKQIARDSRSINQDRAEIARLQEESEALKKRIHELKTEPQVFNRSMDERSKQQLELPAVHFLCKHSYNLKTIEDNPTECPICAPRHRETLRIRRDMKAGTSHQDQFFMELKGKKDGFAVVADWFGRGMLNVRSHSQE